MEKIRKDVWDAVSQIVPFDDGERQDKADTLAWIESGAPLCRVQKPDIPNKHLVSYFVVVDVNNGGCLLVDHKNAQKWLPTGGHVEPGEAPTATVLREASEELGKPFHFLEPIGDKPTFISCTTTVGLTAGHTDVSLWYVVEGSSSEAYNFDPDEFNSIRWFSFDEILNHDPEQLDRCMHRFIRKLRNQLVAVA
jgi:8-oxo-dGTP pyrophosphatase MutT (NUDIX family)